MNFLAHVFLACGNPDLIVGQLSGDFIRGSSFDGYPAAIVRGIEVHRAVDSYTDSHQLNLEARSLFDAPHRRYAGIICDVLYDHFLALEWQNYSDQPLNEYVAFVIEALEQHHHNLPPRLRDFVPYFKSENILQNNVSRDHIELTLMRISTRRASMAPLATAAPAMWQQESQLKKLFDEFFPQLIAHTCEVQKQVQRRDGIIERGDTGA